MDRALLLELWIADEGVEVDIKLGDWWYLDKKGRESLVLKS